MLTKTELKAFLHKETVTADNWKEFYGCVESHYEIKNAFGEVLSSRDYCYFGLKENCCSSGKLLVRVLDNVSGDTLDLGSFELSKDDNDNYVYVLWRNAEVKYNEFNIDNFSFVKAVGDVVWNDIPEKYIYDTDENYSGKGVYIVDEYNYVYIESMESLGRYVD